ncbi:hypothetical protein [Lactiplantibacillus plantarum]|uniref:hypothetical protein n=1 Tax=Lactiplantibacillus plantarum TaxID=1590 RepID=UPI00097735F6|nr:hypothetical protein [Lactiplantibacillus plantarum]
MTKNSMSFDKVVGKSLNVEQLQKVSGGQFKNDTDPISNEPNKNNVNKLKVWQIARNNLNEFNDVN